MMVKDIIGIDAGASIIKAGRFDADLQLQESIHVASGASSGVLAYFEAIQQVIARLGAADLVGLALSGTLSRDGEYLLYAANVVGLGVQDRNPVRLPDVLAGAVGTIPFVADNDAACAGLAEWGRGRGRMDPTKTLLHVTWGTGIGTALVVRGKSQYGWEGGHMPVSWSDEAVVACGCGSVHDLESFIAVPHLVKLSGLTSEELLTQAEDGNDSAAHVVQTALQWLARGLHMMSVVAYPDIVTLGGGFMANDWLLVELRKHIQAESEGYLSSTLRPDMVHRAVLGNDAGMIGAALLAKQRFG